jgi:hypothetical protein
MVFVWSLGLESGRKKFTFNLLDQFPQGVSAETVDT